MIYLDHAATTPVPKAVADAMYTVLTEEFGNPSAQYPMGQEMHRRVDAWRAVIAGAVGCEAKQLYFTSCGTEGDNWAIRAACSQLLPAAGAGWLGGHADSAGQERRHLYRSGSRRRAAGHSIGVRHDGKQ